MGLSQEGPSLGLEDGEPWALPHLLCGFGKCWHCLNLSLPHLEYGVLGKLMLCGIVREGEENEGRPSFVSSEVTGSAPGSWLSPSEQKIKHGRKKDRARAPDKARPGSREPRCTWVNRRQSKARSCCNSCRRGLGLV